MRVEEVGPVIVLANARVVTSRRVLWPGWVSVEGTRIAGVGAGDPPPLDGVVHDLAGAHVLPGFVDLHMHGGGGAQITTDDPDEIIAAIRFHQRHGTTRTLSSLVTDQLDRMAASIGTIAEIIAAGGADGTIAGVHLEGPFLNPAKKGSHHGEYLLAPDPVALRHLLGAGAGTVRVVTLAPELAGGMDLVRDVAAAGVIPAVGHTDATFGQARQAFSTGARLATHLFNAMRPFHHRDPGPAGAALADETVVCELINDGVHVHDDTVRIATAAAGPERIAFVTDATPAAGMTDGQFHLGPVPVFARDGNVTLRDGTIAGSTLTMDAAVRHAVHCVGLPIHHAAIAAATTPATLLGLADRTGSVHPGKDADLVVLDAGLRVTTVVIRGTVRHGTLP